MMLARSNGSVWAGNVGGGVSVCAMFECVLCIFSSAVSLCVFEECVR